MTTDDAIAAALASERTIDITTTGRKTGKDRRIEIWFHNLDGRIFITGMPGTRGWYANVLADPRFTFHLKESVEADLPATARAVRDDDERRVVLGEITSRLGRHDRLDDWLARSPLVEVEFA